MLGFLPLVTGARIWWEICAWASDNQKLQRELCAWNRHGAASLVSTAEPFLSREWNQNYCGSTQEAWSDSPGTITQMWEGMSKQQIIQWPTRVIQIEATMAHKSGDHLSSPDTTNNSLSGLGQDFWSLVNFGPWLVFSIVKWGSWTQQSLRRLWN